MNVRTTLTRQLNVSLSENGMFVEIRRKIGEKKLEDGSVVPIFYDQENDRKDARVAKLSRDEIILIAESLKAYIEGGVEKFKEFVERSGYGQVNGGIALVFYHAGKDSEKRILLSVFRGRNGEKITFGISEKDEEGKWDREYVIGVDPAVTKFVFEKAAERIIQKELSGNGRGRS